MAKTWADGGRYNEEGYRTDGRRQILGFRPIQGSGLDARQAMQNRNVPAFYNPYNQRSSAPEMADQMRRTGSSLTPQGIVPFGFNPGFQPEEDEMRQVRQPMPIAPMQDYGQFGPSFAPTPASDTMAGVGRAAQGGMGPGFAPQQDNGFAQRLAEARAAVEERKNMQAMQTQTRQSQFSTPSPGNVTLRSPYGTGSATFGQRQGPASFDGVSRDDWFRGAANRQRQSNKFGMTMEDEIAAKNKQLGKGVS